MPEIVGFVGSQHKDRNLNFDAQRCINMFPEISASGTSKTPAKLVSAPGLAIWKDLRATLDRPVRGMIKFNESTFFVVVGTKVFKITSGGDVLESTGEIAPSNQPVSIASNGLTLFMVTGPKGYIINPVANTVTEYINASFAGADAVYFIAGSFVFNKYGTSQFQAMNPYSTTLDPLWFATAEGSPDALITLAVNLQEVWLFGTETIEVWVNDGSAGFPFSRIPGVFIEQGCAAKNSVAAMDGTLIWLAANDRGQGIVYQSQGLGLPRRISTHSLEDAISSYATIRDAVAYTYQQTGHTFYVLSFPSANITHVYDATTAAWHQRGYLEEDGTFGRHRSNNHVFFQRNNLVGDFKNGIIYRMSSDIYSDAGNPLVRLRASPHISSGFQKIAHVNLQLDIETGAGLNIGQGNDPKIKLRWSDDGGHAFANTRYAPIGKMGEYSTRVKFNRLGLSRDRVYEVSCSDPVPFTILGAHLNAAQ